MVAFTWGEVRGVATPARHTRQTRLVTVEVVGTEATDRVRSEGVPHMGFVVSLCGEVQSTRQDGIIQHLFFFVFSGIRLKLLSTPCIPSRRLAVGAVFL